MALVFLVALSVGSASPHEVKLVEKTLEDRLVGEKPERLIGDRAYDSDPLDENLAEQGILLIAPHKSNRKKPKTQDGRESPLSKTMEGRAFVCLVAKLSPHSGSL